MDEFFIFLFILMLFGIAMASFVLGVIALVRSSRLERRIAELEKHPRQASAPYGEAPKTAGPTKKTAFEPAAHEPVVQKPTPVPVPVPVTAPVPTPAPKRPVVPPKTPLHQRIDWERWAGCARCGGVGRHLPRASCDLFVKLAIDNDWISPATRCWLGAGAGVLSIIGGGFLRKRQFSFTPNALEGAGLVAMYASIWARTSHLRIPELAERHAAARRGHSPRLCARDPLLLADHRRHRLGRRLQRGLSDQRGYDQPFGLFGYLLLLDLGLLFVGHRKGWPSLGALALLGTFLFESLWIFESMEPDRVLTGLGILAVFAGLFAVSSFRPETKQARGWFASQAGAVILPFAFALHFASEIDFEGHIGSVMGLAAILSIAACILARAQKAPWLAVGGAAASISVLGVWVFAENASDPDAWKFTGLAAGIAALFHIFAELEHRKKASYGHGRAASIAAAEPCCWSRSTRLSQATSPSSPWLPAWRPPLR